MFYEREENDTGPDHFICAGAVGSPSDAQQFGWSPPVRLQPLLDQAGPPGAAKVGQSGATPTRVARHLACPSAGGGRAQARFAIGVVPKPNGAGTLPNRNRGDTSDTSGCEICGSERARLLSSRPYRPASIQLNYLLANSSSTNLKPFLMGVRLGSGDPGTAGGVQCAARPRQHRAKVQPACQPLCCQVRPNCLKHGFLVCSLRRAERPSSTCL